LRRISYKAQEPEEDANQTEAAFDVLQEDKVKLQFDDIEDDVSSQPTVPYLGMTSDHP
jgi:hypothetical protein